MKLLSDTASLVDAAICPKKVMVILSAVFTLAEPSTVASARLLPQLCPLNGCVEESIANSKLPAKAVSAADAALERTGVVPQVSCGMNPVVVPVCVNRYRTSMRSPVLSNPAGSVQVARLDETVPDVEVPTELQTT